ncbi:MAG: DUF1330 domain-containing protein [Rhizobiaceae bacterium]|nr:DUF1330 domain-containing protein [Rhizobiaceae bacterium]
MDQFVNPEKEAFKQFREMDRAGPVHMLNLVKLKDSAIYEDGTMVSGKEAYAAYGRESAPILKKVGGRIFWSGAFELVLIGPGEEAWDIAFIAEYPSPQAFVDMVKDAKYQEAVKHRNAAVETSRLVRFKPQKAGSSFG